MFGIVLANIESLNEVERARYREVYCGICHALKMRYGQVGRVCVNYDMVMVALVRESLFERGESSSEERCIVHPSKKHPFCSGDEVDYAADMSVLFAYHKCLDDYNDDGRKLAKACSKVLSQAYNRVKVAYPSQCEIAEAELGAIREIEKSLLKQYSETGEADRDGLMDQSDEVAKRFGVIFARVFSENAGHWEADLAKFGAQMGRFIYFMDAALDREEDEKSGSFNPFNLCQYADEEVKLLLKSVLGQATDVLERLPLDQDLNLIRSIVYAGVWQKLRAQRQEKTQKENK